MTISVITPAHFNWDDLVLAIDSIDEQTYEDWQHVIVHDCPNPEMREQLAELGYTANGGDQRVFVELGRNWHGFFGGDKGTNPPGPGSRGGRGSRSAAAVLAGTYHTSGEYIAYLDADCTYYPDHLQLCAEEMACNSPWFTYTQAEMVIDGQLSSITGTPDSLRHGTIDGNAVMHKVDLFRIANWRWGGDADWALFNRWLQAGVTYTFIPKVTVTWKHASNDG